MPKNKNTARLARVADAPKVAELQANLEHYRKEAEAVAQPLAQAQAALSAAQDAVYLMERRVLAGKASDNDLAVAQTRLVEAKRQQAILATRAEDAQKMLRLLPAAIDEATCDARAEVAATLRAQYGPAVERLKAALLAARTANAEVSALYDAAYQEFTPLAVHPHYHSCVIDLGDAGLTTAAAGLVPLGWREFQPDGYNQSRFALWLAEAEALLARLPHLAQDDVAHRERAESALVADARREQEKLARLAEVERRNNERFMGVILGDRR